MEERKKIGIYGEMASIALIIIGFLMMVQPFTIILYSYGFSAILSGVILFNIATRF